MAFILQVCLEDYILDEGVALEKRQLIYKFYGSFLRTMLTMFEITLGNWMIPCRALVEEVNEMWMLFFLAHKLIIGFSVLAVITGVFTQETFKVAANDDHNMLLRQE